MIFGYMSIGNHSVTVKAWDNFNNSSEKINYFSLKQMKILLKNLINYPNPFLGETSITANITDQIMNSM